MRDRYIFCKGERLAYLTISEIATKYNAHVFPHLRIKEVAARDWIAGEDFDYALKGHIDFTIAVDFHPVLALELDGRFHRSPRSLERDQKKDAVCEALDIPLVRLDPGRLQLESLQPIIAELIEIWLSDQKRFDVKKFHYHEIPATRLQLEQTANYHREVLGLPDEDDWCLEASCKSIGGGYSEARIELVFPSTRVQLGTGRAKVPKDTRVCGRMLAERMAAANAAYHIRSVRGTRRDVIVESKIPIQSHCELCMQVASAPLVTKPSPFPSAF